MSLGFSEFRELLDIWDNNKEKLDAKCLLEDNGLVFFFKKDNKIYGATENNRLAFARIKNPEKEDKKWADEASFTAVDLEDSNLSKNVFSQKDLENIEVIDQEEVEKKLEKKGKKIPNPPEEEPIEEK
jgi:dGTP triphosphohydrolase